MSNRTVIVNHGLSNLNSIARALEECDANVVVSDDPAVVTSARRLVLPGVGSFAVAMQILKSKGLDEAICRAVDVHATPVLGICLGMQLLAENSVEGGNTVGMGLLPGQVVKLSSENDERIPHMGWNSVEYTGEASLFCGIPDGTDFYFVHSYHLQCPRDAVAATTDYCGGFISAAAKESVMAVQFHPEKSQKMGFRLLENFMAF